MGTHKTLSWVIVVAGLWEIAAPFVLGYSGSGTPLWNAIILGVALVIVGAWAAYTGQEAMAKALDWTGVVAGCWLIIAPFTLGYGGLGNAVWNDVLVGAAVAVLAGWAVYSVGRQAASARGR